MNNLVVIDEEQSVLSADNLPALTYHAYQGALDALKNINYEIKLCEAACKGMDAYIKAGDFSMSSERAQKRLKERTEKAFEASRKWHAKFDGRKVLPKP